MSTTRKINITRGRRILLASFTAVLLSVPLFIAPSVSATPASTALATIDTSPATIFAAPPPKQPPKDVVPEDCTVLCNLTDIWSILTLVLKVMTAGVGVAAVGGVIYAGLLYTTAEDKAEQVKKAKDVILQVTIGLLLYGFMFAILNFLIPGGVFQA